MKCPYRQITYHSVGNDRVEFQDCLRTECPAFGVTEYTINIETLKKEPLEYGCRMVERQCK